MRRVTIRSMGDLDALPENEWVEVVGGMKFTSYYQGVRLRDGDILVPLSADLRRAYRLKEGERLDARVAGDVLIVRRKGARPRRRATKS
jgi:hypothetical protein